MPENMAKSRDEQLVEEALDDWKQMKGRRHNWDEHWEEIAEILWPDMRHTFRPGTDRFEPGERKTAHQLDATPQIALSRFSAIMESLLTPRNQRWHRLRASVDELNRDREVQLWFDTVTDILFRQRYAPKANFSAQNQLSFKSIGGFGTTVMFIDALDGVEPGLRYKSVPIGQVYIRENHQGVVDTVLRYFPLTARQAMQNPLYRDSLPEDIKSVVNDQPHREFFFIHLVKPREDFVQDALDPRLKPFMSVHVSVTGKKLLHEGGFNTFPFAVSRWEQAPNEVYGRSPAMMALPAMKTLMAQKRTILKQGHRAVDPVLLANDDGIIGNVSLRPGAVNFGGVNADGKELIKPLQTGRVDIGLDMMDQERAVINDAFLVQLFQILTETPDRMTATEVIERTREKGILLAPTVGNQQSEYLGPLIEREVEVLAFMGLLPPMPGLLLEARGEFEIQYDSPISRAMRAEEAAGIQRVIESMLTMINITGDPSPMDNFDMDAIARETADIQAVPERWLRSEEDVVTLRDQRAQAQAEQQELEAAGGQAQMIGALAKAKKEGLDVGDT